MFMHGMVISRCTDIPVQLGGGGGVCVINVRCCFLAASSPLAEPVAAPRERGISADLCKDPVRCNNAANGARGSWSC